MPLLQPVPGPSSVHGRCYQLGVLAAQRLNACFLLRHKRLLCPEACLQVGSTLLLRSAGPALRFQLLRLLCPLGRMDICKTILHLPQGSLIKGSTLADI